jgi:lipoyl(octanoyl) transferase
MAKMLAIEDLGRMGYGEAWKFQERVYESVLGGGQEKILLVEHLPVITLGRRGETAGNLKTGRDELEGLGIELVHSDRGGDITYHGPGQIVAYPIIRLAAHGFSVGAYVHRLEGIVIATLKEIGIEGFTDSQAVGVWVSGNKNAQHSTLNTQCSAGEENAKICAIGVRVKRGVSMHGLALNGSSDLTGFSHIVPCGLVGRGVTSVERISGADSPSIDRVKEILARKLVEGLSD